MMTPTIHMNGTSRNSLLDEIRDATHALSVAIEKLCAMRPNARDYYPQGQDAFAKAQEEHQSRITAVSAVRQELNALAESILDDFAGRR